MKLGTTLFRGVLPYTAIAFAALVIGGCGGGSSSTPPPPAPAPQIAISLSTPPPASLDAGAMSNLVATVSNDASNEGVDWSCTPAGSCGSFSPSHTASGMATTYTAPSVAGNVSIIAACTVKSTTSASASVTITAAEAAPGLEGNFVFYVRGFEANSDLYSLAGAATLHADGSITAGEQDFNDQTAANQSPAGGDKITGGSYTLGDDGRGTLTLTTNNTHVGASGTETFHIVKINSKHLLIEQFDTMATGSGSMDLQTTIPGLAALKGPYAFVISGKSGSSPEDLGGTLVANGAGGLTTLLDSNVDQTINRIADPAGTYTGQDSFGRGSMAFNSRTFVYYAIVAEDTRTVAFRLIQTNAAETQVGSGFLQTDQAPAFTTASITGKYVFVVAGNHGGEEGFSTAGQFTADGAGNATGSGDEIEVDSPANFRATGAITGVYTLPNNGMGVLTVTWSTDHHRFAMYPTDPDLNLLDPNDEDSAGGALLMGLDAHVGDGLLLPQGETGATSGEFGINFRAFNDAGETDGIGRIEMDNGAITGSADVNDLFHSAQVTDAAFSGVLSPDAANPGRFTMPLTLTISGTPTVQTIVAYQVTPETFIFLQTDDKQLGTAFVESQKEPAGEPANHP